VKRHVPLLAAMFMLAAAPVAILADDADVRLPDEIPAVLLAQDESTAKPFVCCYGGVTTEGCDQNSPNQIGCEFALAYRCGADEYTCDSEKQTCSCPTPSGDATQTTQ
jgi:hypothetical protein